jgi:transposase
MIKQEWSLDGKFLLSANDENLSVKSLALGYKQLLAVDRAFRTLKSSLLLRPMYLSKDDRNRSHCSFQQPWLVGESPGLGSTLA